MATQRCILNQTVAELRHQFAVEMKMPDEQIQILCDGNVTRFLFVSVFKHCYFSSCDVMLNIFHFHVMSFICSKAIITVVFTVAQDIQNKTLIAL